jgi:hypothetical protein
MLPHIPSHIITPRIQLSLHPRLILRPTGTLKIARLVVLPRAGIDAPAFLLGDIAIVACPRRSGAVDDRRAGEFVLDGFVDAGFLFIDKSESCLSTTSGAK